MAKKIQKHSKYHVYPPVNENIAEWPIYKLSEDRTNFIKEIDAFTLDRIMSLPTGQLNDTIAKTIYLERIRIKEEPWKVDPPNDRLFWKRTQKNLVKKSLDRGHEEARAANEDILKKIIHRYSKEIVGTFKIPTFLFARKFLTFFFNRLLNTAASRNFERLYSSRFNVHDRLKAEGEVEKVRELFKKGTVIMVPTHFSNIDSILLGYTMDAVVGLPSFSYGAGLNLYNSGMAAYFMNRMGAYRLDRRKKNPVYLETLKAMSSLSIQRGTNSLFFPGGTRSRSGALENKLKMGLLGTTIDAQRALYEEGKSDKVFIVPLIMSYHFVLEAQSLIEQYLKKTGKEHYLKRRKESYSLRKALKFAWQFFSQSSDIILSFGKPMDVLGNFVDDEGNSLDKNGKPLDLKEYFMTDGKVTKNLQREKQYTQILADKIVERYHKDNIVLSSHLIAYAAFNILRYQHPNLDFYGVLRLPPDDYVFGSKALALAVEQLKNRLLIMEQNEEIKLSEQIHWEIDKLVNDGVNQMGNYHAVKPLYYNKNGDIISDNFAVLFYYHNRLENYDLARHVQWKSPEMAFEERG